MFHFLRHFEEKKLGIGLPLPPHPQFVSIYIVCEKWTKNLGSALPPSHLDKIQKNSYFFREDFPYYDNVWFTLVLLLEI